MESHFNFAAHRPRNRKTKCPGIPGERKPDQVATQRSSAPTVNRFCRDRFDQKKRPRLPEVV